MPFGNSIEVTKIFFCAKFNLLPVTLAPGIEGQSCLWEFSSETFWGLGGSPIVSFPILRWCGMHRPMPVLGQKQSRDLNSRFSSFLHCQQGGNFFLEIVKKRQNSGCSPWGSEGNALRGIHRGPQDLPSCKILSTSGHRCGHKSRLKFYLWRPLAENSRD